MGRLLKLLDVCQCTLKSQQAKVCTFLRQYMYVHLTYSEASNAYSLMQSMADLNEIFDVSV